MPRVGLTPAIVVERAGALADAEGLDNLTLAALAQRCGVAQPSLYKHVQGLADLRSRVAVEGLRELTAIVSHAAIGRSRGEAVRAVGTAYRRYANEHPGRYAASLRAAGSAGADDARPTDELCRVICASLAGYGINGDSAIDATRMLRAVLHGFVALEAAGGFGATRGLDRSFASAIDALDVALRNW